MTETKAMPFYCSSGWFADIEPVTALGLVVDRSTHRVYLLRFGQFGQTVTGDTEKGKDQVMRSCTCSLPGREDVTVTRATAALGNRSNLVGFIDFANLSTTKQRAVPRASQHCI